MGIPSQLIDVFTEGLQILSGRLGSVSAAKKVIQPGMMAVAELLRDARWRTAEEAQAGCIRYYEKAPLIQAQLRRVLEMGEAQHRAPTLRTPIEVLCDQFGKAIEITSEQCNLGFPYPQAEAEDRMRAAIAELVLKAKPYLWLDDCRVAALQLVEKDPHIKDFRLVREMFPETRMWWTFPNDLVSTGLTQGDDELCGFCIAVFSDAALVIPVFHRLVNDRTVGAEVRAYHLPFGLTLGELWEVSLLRDLGRIVIGMLIFLNSSYIPRETRPGLNRAARRQWPEHAVLPDVTFLNLRAAIHSRSSEGESDREFRHQWLVRGHIRNQWFPSKQIHLPVWIPPYVKGPEGAPMLTHVGRVMR